MHFFDIVNYSAVIGKLVVFLISAVGVEFALWAYVANRYARPSRYFLFGLFYVVLWINLDVLMSLAPAFFSENSYQQIALWIARSMYALLAIFFGAISYFSFRFPAKNYLKKGAREALCVGGWSFLFVMSFTPFIIEKIVFTSALPLAFWVIPGELFWGYLFAAAASLALSFLDLSRGRYFADPENRQKLKFIVTGAGLFGIFNFLFNVIAPLLRGFLGYIGFFSLFASYAVVLILGYIAYQGVKDRLFGIKVILIEIFVGLMGASLLVMPFFVGFLWQQALLIVFFLLFCVFGYALIKSTIKEYREKEMLEQKVLERTVELERAKRDLEKANTVLEERVKARTEDLEKLNKTLEEKIVSRTRDLEAKIRDLEAFQRVTIGRELKMIELKNEIDKLRRQISQKEDTNK